MIAAVLRRALAWAAPRLGAWLIALPVFGQDPDASGTPPRTVALLGASVTAGFVDFVTAGPAVERNRTISLAAACRKIWPRERAQVRDYSDVSLFLAPEEKAARAAARAARVRPALVIAADFMFWFGYGRVPPETSSEAAREVRLRWQEQGLTLLERFDCPLVVGDYPDMHGADPRMIAPAMIPDGEDLSALNAGLRRWAEGRPRVHVFPLGEWVRGVKAEEETLVYAGETRRLPASRLLQTDGLHATRLGVVLLAHRLLTPVRAALPQGDPLLTDLPDASALIDRLGADVDLPPPDRAPAEKAAEGAKAGR